VKQNISSFTRFPDLCDELLETAIVSEEKTMQVEINNE